MRDISNLHLHKLKWEKNYSVRVFELDEQHKKIFEFINLLEEALISEKRSLAIVVRDVLRELNDYASYHFKNEEKYFAKFNYEYSEDHISEHKEYTLRVSLFNKRLETFHRKDDSLVDFSLDLFEFLESWWTEHIRHEDHKYSRCFNEHGLF